MALLTLHDISFSLGDKPLLDQQSFTLEARERIALVGRNGEGKSTLLKIIHGKIIPDDGERILTEGTHITMMPQEVPEHLPGSVYDQVAAGAGEIGALLKTHHHLSQKLAHTPDDTALLQALETAQQAIDARDGWRLNAQVDKVITEMTM